MATLMSLVANWGVSPSYSIVTTLLEKSFRAFYFSRYVTAVPSSICRSAIPDLGFILLSA